jgi:hypothetical protein
MTCWFFPVLQTPRLRGETLMTDKTIDDFHSAALPQADRALGFVAAEYMQYLQDVAMTDAQKIEFLHTLWSIMAAFVNYGWGVDSVIPLLAQKAFESEPPALQQIYPTPNFNVAADD